ncbi:MAG TPA: DUF4347 domain-containing protein [Puia sp.]|nr:DUF4347 domain-containing protein [Puia sp.]
MSTLLHIYDSTDSGIVGTVNSRNYPGTRIVCEVDSANSSQLYKILDNLASSSTRADAILFETHGSPGNIFFGGVAYNAAYFSTLMSRNYDSILMNSPAPKIYFNGCNVAENDVGWEFLITTGKLFLPKTKSGQSIGHTSLGFEIPLYSFFTGHVVHLFGDTRTVFFDSGAVTEKFEQSDL